MPNETKYPHIKKWLKSGDQQRIADELKIDKSLVSKVLLGKSNDKDGIILRASEIALNRKKAHEATLENLKALAS